VTAQPAPADRCDRCGRPSDNALCPRCEQIESEKHTYGWTDCGSYDEMR
jgi:DTW domain-containing protein YfiP